MKSQEQNRIPLETLSLIKIRCNGTDRASFAFLQSDQLIEHQFRES